MKNRNGPCVLALLSGSALLLLQGVYVHADETVQGMLAAQVRTQGYPCEKALGAKRDAKLSRPDYDVWVLECSNASYRVARSPDMLAKVELLR